jgi:Flp pilus assembly protein TadB
VTALLVAAVAGAGAVGVLLMVSAWSDGQPARAVRRPVDTAALLRPAAAAALAATSALVVTGWVVAGLAAGVATVAGVRAWEQRRGRNPKREQARVEALAAWCEQLRDLLSADHGIVGTIDATVRTCPAPIRAEVAGLSVRLSRQSASEAVGRFADEMDDPSADLVASVILLAMQRSSRTAEMLSELAVTIRDRASMRLRVEAERAGSRSEARVVIGFSALVMTGVAIFGRDSEFLDAYDDTTGQAVLAVVFAAFAAGIWSLSRLGRFDRPARFLSVRSAPVGGEATS